MQLSVYDKECLARAKQIIDKDSSVHYNIQELAQKTGLSSTRLKAGFKLLYGAPIFQYLREQRMQKAVLLLEDNNNTIKQIAKRVGFKYTSNFIIAFKKKYGRSPGKTR